MMVMVMMTMTVTDHYSGMGTFLCALHVLTCAILVNPTREWPKHYLRPSNREKRQVGVFPGQGWACLDFLDLS